VSYHRQKPYHDTTPAAPVLISCPLCTSIPGWRNAKPTCCVCLGQRRIALPERALSAWARLGCQCQTCLSLSSPTPVSARPNGPHDTFASAFAARVTIGGTTT
jgi:hypothetical protein